jgi:hypothetical protein
MDYGLPNITLDPGNNSGQIQLSDGASPNFTNYLTYEKIEIKKNNTNPSILMTIVPNEQIVVTDAGGVNSSITGGGLTVTNTGNTLTSIQGPQQIKIENTTDNKSIDLNLLPGNYYININNGDLYCNDVSCNTINGLIPGVVGLDWSSFTGTSAFANLPTNQSYVVDNGTISTSQSFSSFNVTGNSSVMNITNTTITNSNSTNEYMRYDLNSNNPFLRLGRVDPGVSVYEPYSQMTNGTSQVSSYYNTNSKYWTLQNYVNPGSSTVIISYEDVSSNLQPLSLKCSYLDINGSTYIPRFQNNYNETVIGNFAYSGGNFYQLTFGGSPFTSNFTPITIPIGTYLFTLAASSNGSADATGACYFGFYDSNVPTTIYPNSVCNTSNPLGSIALTTFGSVTRTQFNTSSIVNIITATTYNPQFWVGFNNGITTDFSVTYTLTRIA